MKQLKYTGQYKKDLKRYINQPKKLKALNEVLDMLKKELPLPKKYRQHTLQGEYSGCLECHTKETSYSYGMIRKTILLYFFDSEPIQNYSRNKKFQGEERGAQIAVLRTMKKCWNP